MNKLVGRDERDHLVELLKRNHDVMVDKYEEQRNRNEMLEKTAIEKERLYHEIKLENDQIANQSYKMQRGIEELANERRILETKLKNCEAILRQTQEEYRQMKVAHDKADATAKLLSEQLDSAKKTIEEISLKKQQELDLINKEISSLSIKERDAKQRAYMMEG
jgi:hypothetical protein